ncbi:chemotaxis protein CheB [Stutzerimonas tarimensis]|uniref:protein-glutamate methylesterase n=1 Tax=Stutzerimonas tarimensis TaxID=1507735 RepID=A0ABV7T5D3_9GAMM
MSDSSFIDSKVRTGQRRIEALVLGASAGGLQALAEILEGLPADFRLPLLVVQHIPADAPSRLAEVFALKTALRVKEVDDKDALSPGTLYFAAPDYHLLVEADFSLSLSQDEPVRFSRPSIDVLFESAAQVWGPHVAGVLLSGASDDGATGLHAIHLAGGLSIVQDPLEALVDTMPRAALARFTPDYVLPVKEIHRLLCKLETSHV